MMNRHAIVVFHAEMTNRVHSNYSMDTKGQSETQMNIIQKDKMEQLPGTARQARPLHQRRGTKTGNTNIQEAESPGFRSKTSRISQ